MSLIGISGKIGSGKDTIANIIQYLTRPMTSNSNITISFEKWQEIGLHHNFSNIANWKIKKFAGKLKEITASLIGCRIDQLEDINFKNKELGSEWSTWKLIPWGKQGILNGLSFTTENLAKEYCDLHTNSQHQWQYEEVKMTPRKLLQLMGTECGREIIHPNIWINALFTDYDNDFHATKFSVRQGLEKAEYPNWLITDVRFLNEVESILKRKGILIRVNRHLTFNSDQLYDLAMDKLDMNQPNMDYSHEIARKLELNYDEATELYVDIEDLYRGKEHPSENSLDNYDKFHYIIDNNGSIEDLVLKVKEILVKEKIIN